MSTTPTFTPIADRAVLVEFAEQIDDAAGEAVQALDRAIAAASPPGVIEVVPAYVSLLVDFDPLVTDHVEVEAAIRRALRDRVIEPANPREHIAHICFDEDFGPDLDAVAAAVGSPVDDVIEAFLGSTYSVAMYGFAPGYAYLAGVPDRIRVPRKPSPVRNVPAGSVIIAGPQCLITTITMPTGWSIIGRSPTAVLRPHCDPPFLFDPGDLVHFERVDRAVIEAEATP